jgi:hypothetical protein
MGELSSYLNTEGSWYQWVALHTVPALATTLAAALPRGSSLSKAPAATATRVALWTSRF